jgi:hypothetical protein
MYKNVDTLPELYKLRVNYRLELSESAQRLEQTKKAPKEIHEQNQNQKLLDGAKMGHLYRNLGAKGHGAEVREKQTQNTDQGHPRHGREIGQHACKHNTTEVREGGTGRKGRKGREFVA